ncbi:MAG: Uncharacterised protein [Prochlorococcus marinus str. MIT 9215]|nr:MAG: Uncharacterised protein [Prochlorococcus marinus str. MIT 9215]
MVLLEQLHGLTCYVAAAACASRRATTFNTHHAIETRKHKVFRPQLLAVKVNLFKDVNHCWHHAVRKREGAVVLWIAADLKHPLAKF